jgi:GT2 family glycosyltransferase
VSVLMAVHNGGPFVRDACASILGQSFGDFELVVIDDGSTDDSLSQVQALARADDRVRVHSRERRGLIATRNELLAEARAPLIAWMDADDVATPDRLALQVACFDRDPSLICVGGTVLEVDPDGSPISPVDFPISHEAIGAGLTQGSALRFPATMMRREPVLRVGGFREPFKIGEDLDLFCRLYEIGKLENLPDVVLHYRQHPNSASYQLGRHWAIYRDAILALAQERRTQGQDALQRGEVLSLALPAQRPPALPLLDVYVQWARRALQAGFATTARKYAFRALRLEPAVLATWKLSARVLLQPWLAPVSTGNVDSVPEVQPALAAVQAKDEV